jgi:CheY-like chemotaxis protein/anti-sigma regulatory factor (Ser/Thr protein kinase)
MKNNCSFPGSFAAPRKQFVGNAIKYSGEGVVTIRATRTDQVQGHEGEGASTPYRIEVADQGPGIPKAQQHLIFAPFTQLHASQKSMGTGLGLSITKTLAEALGGRVGVESEEGHGCTFWVEVPFKPLPRGSITLPLFHSPLELAPSPSLPGSEEAAGAAARAETLPDDYERRRASALIVLVSRLPLPHFERCLSTWRIRHEHVASVEELLARLPPDQPQPQPQPQPHTGFIVDAAPEEGIRLAQWLQRRGAEGADGESRKVHLLTSVSLFSSARRQVEQAQLGKVMAVAIKPVELRELARTTLEVLGLAMSRKAFGLGTPPHNQGEAKASPHKSGLRSRRPPHLGDLHRGQSGPMVQEAEVLVVEDNPVNQAVMKRHLEKLGARFLICSSGEEALALWRESHGGLPLILMDAHLAGALTGLDAAEQIRQEERERELGRTFIAMVSGRAEQEASTEALQRGCDTFLTKPVDLDTIATLVRRHAIKRE